MDERNELGCVWVLPGSCHWTIQSSLNVTDLIWPHDNIRLMLHTYFLDIFNQWCHESPLLNCFWRMPRSRYLDAVTASWQTCLLVFGSPNLYFYTCCDLHAHLKFLFVNCSICPILLVIYTSLPHWWYQYVIFSFHMHTSPVYQGRCCH